MKKHTVRLTSLFSCIALVVTSVFPLFTLVSATKAEEYEILDEIPYEYPYEEGDLELKELKTAELDMSTVPDFLNPEEVTGLDHVKRLYAQEPDEYTVIFQNRDASKTVYIFSVPVKNTERDLHTDEIDFTQNSIYSSDNGLLKLNLTNSITERLKSCAERTIGKTAIGLARLESASGTVIDITDRIKKITGTEEGLASGINLDEGENGITSGNTGLLYLSLTYNEISGIFGIKNNYNSKFLINSRDTSAVTKYSRLLSILGEWVFIYYNSGTTSFYEIRPLGRQWLYLKYSSTHDSVSVDTVTQATVNNVFWRIEIADEDDLYFMPRYYSQYMMNGDPGMEEIYEEDPYPEECSFRLTNHREFTAVENIYIPSVICMTAGTNIEDYFTVYPSDATVYSTIWLLNSTSGPELEYDEDNQAYQTINEPGTYTVCCKDIYSETYSGYATVIVGEECEIGTDEKITYMIRPVYQGETTCPNILTMGGATSGTNAVSITGLYNGGTTYSARWTDKSQIFTVYKSGGSYKIAATLSATQYTANGNEIPTWSRYEDYNSVAPTKNYQMIDKYDVPNYLRRNGTGIEGAMSTSSDISWKIMKTGTQTYSGTSYNTYLIYQEFGTGGNRYYKVLTHSATSSVTQTISCPVMTSQVSSCKWIITKTGLDIPLIKQTQDNWCGYTTILQVLYGAGTNSILSGATEQIHSQITAVFHEADPGTGGGMSQSEIIPMLNGTYIYTGRFANGLFDRTNYSYVRTGDNHNDFESNTATNTCEKMVNLIRQSLDNKWAPFIMTHAKFAPYMTSDGNAHYICIIGYDAITDCVIVSNCHYIQTSSPLYGVFAIPSSSFYDAVAILFYSVHN